MLREQRLHRAAQQCGVVAGHRRHHQHGRMRLVGVALEMDQVTERFADHRDFPDRHLLAIHLGGWKPECRLAEPPGRPLEQLSAGSESAAHSRVRRGQERILESGPGGLRHEASRIPSRVLEIIELVEHDSPHIHRLNDAAAFQMLRCGPATCCRLPLRTA
jgi:hypothetical protein